MSISLSVSEVETAVLERLQLGEMITKVGGRKGEQPGATTKKVELVKTSTKAKVKNEKKPPHGFLKGTGLAAASHPSTDPSNTKKARVKTEAPGHEKEEGPKTEVMTYARMDTPSGSGDSVAARFTFSRQENEEMSDEDERADHGNSDGEGGAIPCVIPDRLTLRPLTVPAAKRGAKNGEEQLPAIPPIKGQESKRNNDG